MAGNGNNVWSDADAVPRPMDVAVIEDYNALLVTAWDATYPTVRGPATLLLHARRHRKHQRLHSALGGPGARWRAWVGRLPHVHASTCLSSLVACTDPVH